MALLAGDPACTTGLANRLYVALLAGPTGAQDNAALKATCYAIATAIVLEITTNAQVLIPVTAGALQTSTLAGTPTGPPLVQQSLGVT
jgi:hypothetical protein